MRISLAVRCREQRADGEEVLLDVHEQRVDLRVGGDPAARATPIVAFSSSTSPYASTRGWLFGTRPPPKSPVSPVSPVFV